MGWQFPIEAANLVAYLTAPPARQRENTPRLSARHIAGFLRSLQQPERNRFYSRRERWLASIRDASHEAERRLFRYFTDARDFLYENEVRRVVAPLRKVFGQFPLVALAVADSKHYERAERFIRHAGETSGPYGLFLLPDALDDHKQARIVLDPFPAIAQIGNFPERLPGVVFWTRAGSAVMTGFDEAEELYESLRTGLFESALSEGFRQSDQLIDERLRSASMSSASVRVTHLSDLHFGNNAGWKAKRFLLNRLRETELPKTDHVVITGDLLANPTADAADMFEEFRYDLMDATGSRDVIVIPGNHDRKWLGNSILGVGIAPLLDLQWKRVHVDPKLRVVFICFDSSGKANFAKGKISQEQLQAVGLDLSQQLKHYSNPERFLKVALIHHHPYSFETHAETPIQRILKVIGKSDEQLLLLENAAEVLSWCADVGVSLILHGHKHIPRYVQGAVKKKDGSTTLITSVGCGSSLGAEETPLCYDVVRWDPESHNWTVSFFSDPGDHRGFTQDAVAINYAGGN